MVACGELVGCSIESVVFVWGPSVFSAAVRLCVLRVFFVPVPAAALSVVLGSYGSRLPGVGLNGCQGICNDP